MELQEAKKAVIYKVGRNVLLFQQMEHILKYLVTHGKVSGHPSELVASTKKHAESVIKQTLGWVAGEYLDSPEPISPPDDLKEPHVTFSFKMDYHTDKKEVFKMLVAERNHLVHHFLSGIDDGSVESWNQAGQKLDSQSEKLKTQLAELRQVVEIFHDLRQDMANFILSDEFKEPFFK